MCQKIWTRSSKHNQDVSKLHHCHHQRGKRKENQGKQRNHKKRATWKECCGEAIISSLGARHIYMHKVYATKFLFSYKPPQDSAMDHQDWEKKKKKKGSCSFILYFFHFTF